MTTAEAFLVGYFRLMSMNGASHVYRAAGEMGVFRQLLTRRQTAAELAESCGLMLRPAKLLLEALAALEIVVPGDAEVYSLSPLGQMLLSGSYRHLGDEYWAHLCEFLRTGTPIEKMDDVEQSEAHYQAQAAVLGWMLGPAAECAARMLHDKIPAGAAILDVGAGSAVWSLTLAKQDGDASVTAVDWPAVLEVARETAEQFSLQDRLTTIPGNYHEVEIPEGHFDLAILANVTHLETPEGNRRLLRKVARSLKPSGRVAIVDVFSGQRHGDLNRTLYALGLALRTRQGQAYTQGELTETLRECGFGAVQLLPLEVPPYVMGMLLAEKARSSRRPARRRNC